MSFLIRECREAPFGCFVVSIWALLVWGGVKACLDGLGHFFPMLPGGVRACKDGLGHFFHVCPFDRGSKAIWAMPI